MFGPKIPLYSFGTILSGISKTLNIVNQAIPLYNQISPAINNARNALTIIKEFNNKTINKTTNNINTLKQVKNRPTFFQ